MSEIDKARKLLVKYKKKNSIKIKDQLVSYVLKYQSEIFNRKFNDRDFRPTVGDEYQDKRDLLKDIREELDLVTRTSHQHPPRNIDEIRDRIEEMGKEGPKQ